MHYYSLSYVLLLLLILYFSYLSYSHFHWQALCIAVNFIQFGRVCLCWCTQNMLHSFILASALCICMCYASRTPAHAFWKVFWFEFVYDFRFVIFSYGWSNKCHCYIHKILDEIVDTNLNGLKTNIATDYIGIASSRIRE